MYMKRSGTELSGSVRKIIKHPVRKNLNKEVSVNSELQDGQFVSRSDSDVSEEYQKIQDIKRDLAERKGVAVTSEEHAVEFDKKANELKDKSDVEIQDELSKDDDEEDDINKQRNVSITKKVIEQSKKDDLLEKIKREIDIERERAKLLYVMENSRKNTIDYARSRYGDKADISSIQQSYDIMANNIDPKIYNITDMISMSIDNKLHGDSCVKMLMPNGSVRLMDADVAFAMSELSDKIDFLKRNANMAAVESDGLASNYTVEDIKCLSELSNLMDENIKRQEAFEYKDPRSGELEIQSKRNERLRKIGLPTLAMDYDYVYNLNETTKHNDRPLPSAMDSYEMQSVMMQSNVKNYGYYQ